MDNIAVVRNLVIRAGADFGAMRREMAKANKDLKEFGSKMKSAVSGIALALGGLALGAGMKSIADDAMKVEASMQQINRTMGESGKEFANWAKTSAGAFNMSRSEAIRYGDTFSNLVSTFESSKSAISDHTKALLKASSIISAAKSMDMSEVLERMRSGMLGNTEAIEDLGVNVNASMLESTEAFKKFANGKSWDQLDFKVKQQIIMFGILEQTTKKYGDTLADNTASRLGAFTTQLKNARLSLGQAFLPIINVILPSLTAFASSLARVMSLVAQFSQALFGKSIVSQAKSTEAQAGAVGGLGDAYEEAGKKAKKASSSLASFDEVNSLGGGSGDEADAADAGKSGAAGLDLGAGGIGEATDGVSSAVQEMANKVKKAFGEMTDFITEHKEIIIAALGGISAAFATLLVIRGVSTTFQIIGAAITAIFSPIGLLVIAIAALSAAFIYLWRNNEDFKRGVLTIWEDVKNGLIAAWQSISDAAVAIWGGLKPFFEDTFNFIDTIARAIWDGMKFFWENWGADITAIFSTIWNTITKVMIDIFRFIADKLGVLAEFWNQYWPGLAKALINVFKILWFVLEPYVNAVIQGIKSAFEALMPALEAVWEDIKKIVSGALDIIMGAIKIFIGIFTLDWDTFWGGIKQTVSGAWDAISGIIKLGWDVLNGIVQTGAAAVKGLIVGLWEGVRENTKEFQDGIASIVSSVWDGIVSTIKNSINSITGMINSFIDKFNGIKISIPGFTNPLTGNTVGGFEIGMPQIPKLPMLKRGGIVDGATNMGNYIAGEAGTEMIVPLENTSFVDKLASALGTAVLTAMQVGNNNKAGTGDTIINIDGTTIARAISPYLNKENNRSGGSMLTVT